MGETREMNGVDARARRRGSRGRGLSSSSPADCPLSLRSSYKSRALLFSEGSGSRLVKTHKEVMRRRGSLKEEEEEGTSYQEEHRPGGGPGEGIQVGSLDSLGASLEMAVC